MWDASCPRQVTPFVRLQPETSFRVAHQRTPITDMVSKCDVRNVRGGHVRDVRNVGDGVGAKRVRGRAVPDENRRGSEAGSRITPKSG